MSGELWQLGPLKVEPGHTLRGVFQVDVGVAQIDFPIALINGTEPDPVLLVTAGMDGDEYGASEAALRLIDALDPSQLAGRVMVCPVLDPLSFEARHSQNPLDGLFLKHVFPGDLEGKPTQRLAHFIYHNFLLQADAWIDLQMGETSEDIRAYTWTYQGEDSLLNEQNAILLRQSGADIGLLHPPYTWEPAQAAVQGSAAALISVAGRRYHTDEAPIEAHLHTLQSILRGMGMLPREGKPTPPTIYLDHEPVLAEITGLWYPRIKAGDAVSAGQVLGEVFKLDGSSVVQEVKSTVDGVALAVQTGLATRPRLRLALIAHRPQQDPADETDA
jgi:predicted deacylase